MFLKILIQGEWRENPVFLLSILDILKLRRWLCPIKPMEGGGGQFSLVSKSSLFHWFKNLEPRILIYLKDNFVYHNLFT